MNITTTGSYAFRSYSNIDMLGLIYNTTLVTSNYLTNLLNRNDNFAGDGQFIMTMTLLTEMRYILVITTGSADIFGSFTIAINGPGYVNLTSYLP